MGDERLRSLERRFKQSGSLEDEDAWFREFVRTKALDRRLAQLLADVQDEDDLLEGRALFFVLPVAEESAGLGPKEHVASTLRAAGYPPLERARDMEREEALRYLCWRCHETQAYSEMIQPQQAAERMAHDLLGLLPTWPLLFANVSRGWSKTSQGFSQGLTNHTFDDGVVAWAGSVVVVIWFSDDD